MVKIRQYIVPFLFLFFFLVSCRTVRDQSAMDQQSSSEEEVSAGEELGDVAGGENKEESDLEEEFADSEDFEKEMAEEAFPDGLEEQADPPKEQQKLADAEEDEEFADEDLIDEEDQVAEAEAEKPPAGDLGDEDLIDEEDQVAEVEDSESTQTADAEAEKPPAGDEDPIDEGDQAADTEDSEGAQVADTESEQAPAEESGDEDQAVFDDADEGTGSTVVINSIRYESKENKIYIEGTGSLSYQSRQNKEANQFVIEAPGAVLSDSLRERPFVMKDFNTEMAFLQADQKDSNTVRIVVQMRENASMPTVRVAEDGSLVVAGDSLAAGDSQNIAGGMGGGAGAIQDPASSSEILPAKSLEEFFMSTPQFSGRPISIHLRDVNVRDVLYFISEGTGLNMVLSDDVTGTISIKLRNVPWDQALVTVMKTKELGYIREGNVIRIMSLSKLKADQENMKKMIEAQKVLDPVKVKVIPLIYKKPQDVSKQISGLTTKDRGKVVVDNSSNSLIVTDTTRAIELIELMVKNLDKSPTQVMIEAKVIEARERFVRNLGVSWGYNGTAFNSLALGGAPELALSIDGGLEAFPGNVTSGRTLSSNLQVGFAPIGELDITLGLSEAEDLIHVVSAPRIMVLNGERAKITQKTEDIDLITTTQQGAGTQRSPQRVSADLEFEVSPQITAVGSIFMDIKMKREFFGPPEAESGSRPVNSREAETKVLVHNGQTIVIGGIYQHDETESDEGIPILRHIPILNWIFSRFTRDEQRNELLLFLTPRIMNVAGLEPPPEDEE